MNAQLTNSIFYMMLLCILCLHVFSQQNEDSLLLSHSEKWKVKQNKGMFGLAKPQFGPYTTINVGRADVPVMRKKTKDGAGFSADISGKETDFDISKYLTIAKTKSYQMQLATQMDTAKAVFTIASVSKEKRQTSLGKMLSKNDEGKEEVLSYNRDIAGIITTTSDGKQWIFFIDNYTSGSRSTAAQYYPPADMLGAYLKSENDSLTIQMNASIDADLIVVNNKGEHLAALKFKQSPAYIWIRNDLEEAYRQSIAAFFAVIVGIRDL